MIKIWRAYKRKRALLRIRFAMVASGYHDAASLSDDELETMINEASAHIGKAAREAGLSFDDMRDRVESLRNALRDAAV